MSEGVGKVTVIGTGPYKVEPGCQIFDAEGRAIETKEGQPFFLCRCGHSSNKPFCDGTHKEIDWDPTLAARE